MASVIDRRYASSLGDLYPRPDGSRPLDLDDCPTFTTSREWGDWGYDRGLEGLDVEVSHTLPHTFFCAAVQGWRAGRYERASRALLESAPTDEELAECEAWSDLAVDPEPMPYEEMAGLLDEAAEYYGRQTGTLAAMLAHAIRTRAADVRYYRTSDTAEFEAREAEHIEAIGRCFECERAAYLDRQ